MPLFISQTFNYSLCTLAMSLLLSSCGGTGSSESNNQPQAANGVEGQIINLQGKTIRKIGFVGFDGFTTNTNGAESHRSTAYGEFYQLSRALNDEELSQLENEIGTFNQGCEIVLASVDAGEDLFGITQTGISAGDVLTVTSPAGTWASPELMNQSSDLLYYDFPDESVEGLVPSNSTIDVPGGDFQSFANVPIPEAQPMRNINVSELANNRISFDSEITWTPGDNHNDEIAIFMDHDGANSDESASDDFTIRCLTRDTGTFTIPANVKNEIESYSFQTSNVNVLRGVISYIHKGDALLQVTRISRSISWQDYSGRSRHVPIATDNGIARSFGFQR